MSTPLLNPTDIYFAYLGQHHVLLDLDTETRIRATITATDWDEPRTGRDFNNWAVIALIEAENAEDYRLRETYIGLAEQYLEVGSEDYPLCLAHHLMVQLILEQLIGNPSEKLTWACYRIPTLKLQLLM